MRFCILTFAMLALAGCQLPSIEKAQRAFSREHPETTVLGMSEQLTNRFYAEFHIYYTRPGDSHEHEDVWDYHHAAEAWVPGSKETVR
jgi:hypothetical protein